MSISAREVAVLVQGLTYLILTISAARQFARTPGQLRLHILLIFASGTGSLLLREISLRLFTIATEQTTAQMLLQLSFVSQFSMLYGAFLLARDLAQVGPWIKWVGNAILLLTAGSIVLILGFPSATRRMRGLPSPILPAIIFLAFAVGLLFLVFRLWRSSVLASGANRSRLQWLGTASTLAFLGTITVLGHLLAPGNTQTTDVLQHLLLLLSGIILYLGCMPPNWLRRLWTLPELEQASQFCNALILGPTELPPSETTHVQTTAINQILQNSMP